MAARWLPVVLLMIGSFGSTSSALMGQDAVQQEIQRLMGQELTEEEIVNRISTLGLSRDDLRGRLGAMGYDEILPTLDAYFDRVEGAVNPQAVSQQRSNELVAALSEMGLITLERDRELEFGRDSIVLDSMAIDSLGLETGLNVFGRSIFEDITAQFQPLTFGPVDPGYLLGPGDQVQLFLTGEIELAYNLDVTREGFVIIPDVGQVSVNGLTLTTLRENLYSRLSSVYSGVQRGPEATTRFHLSLGRLRTNQVFLIGEVTQPGAYQMSPAATIFNALYSARGPNMEGSMRSVQVRRAGQLAGELDVYDYLLRGDASEDFRIEQGDFVFVPLAGPQVSIEGEVRRSAIYEIKSGEGLLDLIEFSGGLSASAFSGKIQIDRILPVDQRTSGRERVIVDVDLDDLNSGQFFPLYDGDRVFVEPVLEERTSRVAVTGQVQRAGDYQLVEGMTVQDLIRRSGGLRRDAFGQVAHLERMNYADSSYALTQINLDSEGRANPNPLLQDFDRITVFGNAALSTRESVYIGGEVKDPSTYEFSEGMTVEDIVLIGGGFTANADPLTVEVLRRVDDAIMSDQISNVIHVSFGPGSVPFEVNDLDETPLALGRELASSVQLQPDDRVFVRRLQNRRSFEDVILTGEVLRPGNYSRLTRDETVTQLVARAGGLTAQADVAGFRLTRDDLTLGLDFEAALANASGPEDIRVFPGDSIYVPEYNPIVTIEGAVEFESRARWVDGLSVQNYLDQAGGVREDGDRDRTVVTYANNERRRSGKFLFFRSDPEVKPGTVITVPEKLEVDGGFNVDQWLTRVLSMATVLVAINGMSN